MKSICYDHLYWISFSLNVLDKPKSPSLRIPALFISKLEPVRVVVNCQLCDINGVKKTCTFNVSVHDASFVTVMHASQKLLREALDLINLKLHICCVH